MDLNSFLHEQCKIVELIPDASDGAAPGDYVSLKNYKRWAIILQVNNGATVTGGAVTLKQATAVAGTSEKALAFAKAWRNIDTGAADALAEFAVTSDTFTTDTTDNKNLMYVMEGTSDMLDTDNGFDCLALSVAAAIANATVSAIAILWGGYQQATPPAAITN